MQFPIYVEQILDQLWQCGYEAFVVGGSLRDRLLGKDAHDYDVTTSATPEQTLSVFSDYRTIPTGLQHGTVTVLSHDHPIEITTYRIDGTYSDSRHPDRVTFTADLQQDLARRDFTVNAMAYSHQTGLVDPFGGREDLTQRVLRAVGEPACRFREDALRIMRAFRFSAQLNFTIYPLTLDAMIQTKDGLQRIARERIGSEMLRLLSSPAPQQALTEMVRGGIGRHVFSTDVPPTYEHVDSTPQDASLRLGFLLRHMSCEQRQRIYEGLRCSNRQRTRAERAARLLLQPWEGTDADARRRLRDGAEDTDALLACAEALGLADPTFASAIRSNRAAGAPVSQDALALRGGDLVAIGYRGHAIKETLEWLLEQVLQNPCLNTPDQLLALARQKKKE